MVENKKIKEIFDFLSAPDRPGEAHGALVFGRYDLRLAQAMGALATDDLAKFFVISGAYGKDSGRLWDIGVPESEFLAAAASAPPNNVSPHMIHTDTKPLDGFDNVRFGVNLMDSKHLDRSKLTAVAHATSLRRLAATLEKDASSRDPQTEKIYRVGTNYPFDPSNPADQREAAAEFVRLAHWPEHGLIAPQTDLPVDLLDYAHTIVPNTPMPAPPLKKIVLRHSPRSLRRRLMNAKPKK